MQSSSDSYLLVFVWLIGLPISTLALSTYAQAPYEAEAVVGYDLATKPLTLKPSWNGGMLRVRLTVPDKLADGWTIHVEYGDGQVLDLNSSTATARIVETIGENRVVIDLPIIAARTMKVQVSPPGARLQTIAALYRSRVNQEQMIDGSKIDLFDSQVDVGEVAIGPGFGRIDVSKPDGQLRGTCTGFRVTRQYWLTAAHCVLPAKIDPPVPQVGALRIQPLDYADRVEGPAYSARIIATGQAGAKPDLSKALAKGELDYALLEVDGDPEGPAFAVTEKLVWKVGDQVQLLEHWYGSFGPHPGKARSAGESCVIRERLGADNDLDSPELCPGGIQHGCSSDEGASGGPLVLRKSLRVVGIHYRRGFDSIFNCATPIEKVVAHLLLQSNTTSSKDNVMQLERQHVKARMYPKGMALRTLVVAGCVIASSGCASQGGYVSPEALSPPASQFTEAMGKFATSIRTDHLASYRRELRNDIFLNTVVVFAGSPNPNLKALSELVKKQPDNFLCAPRYGYALVNIPVGNLEAAGNALGARLKAPGDDLSTLFSSLGESYAIKIDPTQIPKDYDAWKNTDDGKSCFEAIAKGNPFATRKNPGDEIAFAAGLAAIEAIWTVVKPVLVGTLQTVDLERRNAAVKAYFQDEKNVNALKEHLKFAENYLQGEFDIAQSRASGKAVASAAILFDANSPHWAKIRDIATSPRCQAGLKGLGSNKANPVGVSCMNDILGVAAGVETTALDAADAFDVALGQQLPKDNERLSAQLSTVRDIALGKQTGEAELKALWATTLRYFGLFKTFQGIDTKKLSDALSALQKALK